MTTTLLICHLAYLIISINQSVPLAEMVDGRRNMALSPLVDYLSISINHILNRGQFPQPHWPTGMQLLSTDPDFRSEAKAPSVCEAC